MRDRYTNPDRPGFFERVKERATGMSQAQRALAKNPDADIPLWTLKADELAAWRQGEDWASIVPRAANRDGLRTVRSQREPG